DYGTCPFRFFARHVLRLEDMSEPVEGLLARQLGRAYHRVLERVHRELKSREAAAELGQSGETDLQPAGAVSGEELPDLVDAVCNTVLDEMAVAGEIPKDVLWEFEKTEIRRRVMRLLRTEAVWNGKHPAQPVMFERKFGIHGSPLVVGDVQLKGVIDRIDLRDDGLVVIDYKTGATPISHREAITGRNLQLPIYLMAVRDVVWRGKRVAGGYYLHIYSCRKGSEFPGGDAEASVDAVIVRAASYVREYAGRARRGEFPVRPNGPCPPYCEFNAMCRIQSLKAASEG
ncbi:MAG TPA: PD-(D/E)XK nuclease family protein, partial [Blastocatellia bacterium]|nr:PD-(D/E)XK nuclease family protein [Blastocatellia bacterium]